MHFRLHKIMFQVGLNSFVFVFNARTSEMKLTVIYTKIISANIEITYRFWGFQNLIQFLLL